MSRITNRNQLNELMLSFGMPARIGHADGYISLDENGQATFYYYLQDHLGNVRSVITHYNDTPVVVQTNDYFPFGMSLSNAISHSDNPNKHKYNGKEEQEMPGKWLDYGFRFYDPQLGRFHTVDPLAEEYFSYNPYCYVGNNPIRRIDPDGRYWDTDEDKRKAERIQNNLRNMDKSLAKTQARVNKKIDKVNSNDKLSDSKKQSRLETLNKKSDRIQETRSEVQSAINEIGVMGEVDNIAFTFNDLGSESSLGYISHDVNENDHLRITMNHTGALGNVLHEMKHGYQITTGMISPNDKDPKEFWTPPNKAHEVEAYRRQYLITGTHPKSKQYPVIRNTGQINSTYIRTIYYIGNDGKTHFPYL
jgi:RHS repeat-associated protein